MRTGLIGKKIGMTRLFDEFGRHDPVTVVDVSGCVVVGQRTAEKDGYTALRIGYGKPKLKNLSKPLRGEFAKIKQDPKSEIKEFRVPVESFVDVGAEIQADHFVPGQYVDVSGLTIGKGFAGAMKRHNFSGLEASHGVSISHRSHGSTGGRQDPGKVWKGKKMAGHYGVENVTVQNLEVLKADNDKGLLYIRGALPGSKGSLVEINDAIKKGLPADIPYPASVKTTAKPATESNNEAGGEA
jgi:large subunit ribosomal protein L3